jgi:amino acid transporter
MISLVGTAGSFAMIISTIVVLFNGIVVYYLSKRFKRGGGYYIYAFYSLTSRLGLETGWNYILYALAYGGTLLTGGAYVLYTITGFNQTYLALLVSIFASSLVVAGVKVSARYAMIMSLVEMIALVSLSVYFLSISGWHFYNPIRFTPDLVAAVLFGLGIPTGYGSIAPLGEDTSSQKNIGKAAILVLILGGGLASLFFYSLGAIDFTGNLVSYLLDSFGITGMIILSFIALNDGTLGGMAYILGNSRTFKAMADDERFPKIFTYNVKGKPLFSELLISLIFILSVTLAVHLLGLYNTFLTLGALAGFGNIFIHTSADFSLIRLASKKSKKRIGELIVSIAAVGISLWVLIMSLPEISPYIENLFFAWIIGGFLYAEALDIIKGSSEDEKKS